MAKAGPALLTHGVKRTSIREAVPRRVATATVATAGNRRRRTMGRTARTPKIACCAVDPRPLTTPVSTGKLTAAKQAAASAASAAVVRQRAGSQFIDGHGKRTLVSVAMS